MREDHPVIRLGSPNRAPDPAVLHSPGGFTWFYVDLVDDQGRGATVIWSWGLPFLPGYAQAARAGRPEVPIGRPSVNVVVYGGGRERFYLLSELPPEECEWGADGRSWRLGGCSFTWTDTAGEGPGPTRMLHGILDLALPTGGRVTGELQVSGALRCDLPGGGTSDSESTHLWTPMLAASRGVLELNTPGGALRIEGRAYHDRNSATRPLQELGIQSWWWGRLALPGRDLIFYRLTPSAAGSAPRDLVVEIAADGSCRVRDEAGLQVGRLRRSTWGLRRPTGAAFPDPDGCPVQVDISAVLDNGPFYQRYLLRGRCGADEGYGVGENLVPDRVDTDLLRPLVRMRVHRADGPNSMWLPLFSGDSDGRVRRLLGRSGEVRA
jgi:carotenoid 1,2-hydratase